MPQHSEEEKDKRWKRLEPQLQEIIRQRQQAAARRTWPRTLAIAASISLVAVSSVIAYLFMAQVTVQTPAGQTSVLVLPDHSTITLNENTRIRYHQHFFSWRSQRQITLEGEAFFDVMSNPRQPFVITSPHFNTRVLGTSFSIRDYQHLLSPALTVEEGKVRITDRKTGQHLIVTQDETAWLKEQTLVEEPVTNHNAFAWKTGILSFQHDDMRTVLNTLRAYYKTAITVKDPRILQDYFTGSFDHASLEDALETLGYTMNLGYTRQNDQVILYKKEHLHP